MVYISTQKNKKKKIDNKCTQTAEGEVFVYSRLSYIAPTELGQGEIRDFKAVIHFLFFFDTAVAEAHAACMNDFGNKSCKFKAIVNNV